MTLARYAQPVKLPWSTPTVIPDDPHHLKGE